MKAHVNYRIHGRVQGVGFRYSARTAARNLGVTGFVRNEPDGTVYIEAEGEANVLQEFERWCCSGPSFAHVKNLEKTGGPLKDFASFEIEQ